MLVSRLLEKWIESVQEASDKVNVYLKKFFTLFFIFNQAF